MYLSVIIEFYVMISMLLKLIVDIFNDKIIFWSFILLVFVGIFIFLEYVFFIYWLNLFFKVKKFNNF